MSFVKLQKVVYGEDGEIKSGSAAIVDTTYIPGEKNHCKHSVIERLGKVLYWDKDLKSGVFQSPIRGLIEYCSQTNEFREVSLDDPRLPARIAHAEPDVHTIFGDAWFLLDFAKKTGLDEVLNSIFSANSTCQRLWAHVLHSVAKDGSKISCEDWIDRSVLSHLIDAVTHHSLKGDTVYFHEMGTEKAKLAFFKSFIALMRNKQPSFGTCCYVDSTPLPNSIENNPFNALSSHGIDLCGVMSRMVLILDNESGLPVWFEIIPGNLLDLSTLKTTIEDVSATLGITVDDMVLDAGYVSKELIQCCHLVQNAQGELVPTPKTITARMPAKKGFPHKELYRKVKDIIHKAKYSFLKEGKGSYFGVRKEIELWGVKEYAYVYVDLPHAQAAFDNWREDHEEEYEKLLDREKDWKTVEYGFFILISNIKSEPKETLDSYYGRTNIETVFKTSKEYLDLLPLRKWSDTTVRGKILSDIISTIFVLLLRKELTPANKSVSECLGKLSSVICFSSGDNVTVTKMNKQAAQFVKLLGLTVPTRISLEKYRKMITPTPCSV